MRALAALLFASVLLPLATCPPEGECRSDDDCPDGKVCRPLMDQPGNVCIELLDDGGGEQKPPVEITSFVATPEAVARGGTVTLSWTSEHATSCALDQDIGGVEVSGEVEVTVDNTTQYTLSCQGEDGPAIERVTVPVFVEILSLTATPEQVNEGEEVTLAFETVGAEACTLSLERDGRSVPYGGGETEAGAEVWNFPASDTASLVCQGALGPAEASVSVEVAAILSFEADSPALAAGQETTLRWQAENTTGCAVSGLADPDPNDEEVTVSVSETQTFSLLCTGFSDAALQRDVIVPVLIESFTADHATVTSGGGTTLRYRVDEAVSACDVNGEPVDVAAGAHAVENLTETTAFVLRCERPDGLFATSDPVTVEVE